MGQARAEDACNVVELKVEVDASLGLERAAGAPSVPRMSWADLASRLGERGSYRVVDVRETAEFEAGHLEGALSLPRGSLELRVAECLPYRDEALAVHCASGFRAGLAASTLLALGYRRVVWVDDRLERARELGLPWRTGTMGLPGDLAERYARQLLLPEVGLEGQLRLRAARVLVVGLGGLGSPVCLYLAAAGVGTLGLADGDRVDVSNLQRQVLYDAAAQGSAKTESAAARLHALDPRLRLELHSQRLGDEGLDALSELCASYDVVVDGSDNFPTRYLLSDACTRLGKPLVYGAVSRYEGQVSVFARTSGGPCYRCLHPSPPPPGLGPTCAEAGVLGVVPGVIGVLQATEVLKLLLGLGQPLVGRVLHYDARESSFRTLRAARDPSCVRCGEGAGSEGVARPRKTP